MDGHRFIADLTTEMEAPADGILSRVLHNDDHLRVVGFAFAAGEELTEHTAAVPATLQVVSGRISLVLGSHRFEAGPGSWASMEAHLPHSLVALEPSVVVLTMARGGSAD